MEIKKNICTVIERGNGQYSTLYIKIPPDAVRLYDIRKKDEFKFSTDLKTNQLKYDRIDTRNNVSSPSIHRKSGNNG